MIFNEMIEVTVKKMKNSYKAYININDISMIRNGYGPTIIKLSNGEVVEVYENLEIVKTKIDEANVIISRNLIGLFS